MRSCVALAFRLLMARLQLHSKHILGVLDFLVHGRGLLSWLHNHSCTNLGPNDWNFDILRFFDMRLVPEHIRFIYASKLRNIITLNTMLIRKDEENINCGYLRRRFAPWPACSSSWHS